MSWEQLLDIADERRQLAEDERARRPIACPDDGVPLQEDRHGELFCKFCGWREDQPGLPL